MNWSHCFSQIKIFAQNTCSGMSALNYLREGIIIDSHVEGIILKGRTSCDVLGRFPHQLVNRAESGEAVFHSPVTALR